MKHATRFGRASRFSYFTRAAPVARIWPAKGWLAVYCLALSATYAPAQAPRLPDFIVHSTVGPLPAASVEELEEDWSIHLGGTTPRVLSGNMWVSLRRNGVALPSFATENSALLTSGDRIRLEPGAPFRMDEERLFVRTENGAEISVPLAFVSCLCLRVPRSVDDPALFLSWLDRSKRPRDVIYLKGGDSIEGTLLSAARGPYTMRIGARSVATPLDQIGVVALNTELQARPKTKKIYAHVVTTSGARLQFSSLRLRPKSQVLAGKTLFGASLELPLAQVAALALRQAAAVYLSDLTPANYEFTPFLGVKWPLVADAAVTGRQLCLGEDYYDKGLGMHSQSRVTYALDGNYRWFEALVGVDAESGTTGQAKVSVALDGRTALFQKDLSGRDPIVPVRLDVRKARHITLLVEFGSLGSSRGRVNWADARLIR
jgi:hypothetical protein